MNGGRFISDVKMGRSCRSQNSFQYGVGDNTYQIYLVFSSYQKDIKDNPYLKDTKVQIRDSCSWPFKFPTDGKGNDYKFPNGRDAFYFGQFFDRSAINGSDPYHETYDIPFIEQFSK